MSILCNWLTSDLVFSFIFIFSVYLELGSVQLYGINSLSHLFRLRISYLLLNVRYFLNGEFWFKHLVSHYIIFLESSEIILFKRDNFTNSKIIQTY